MRKGFTLIELLVVVAIVGVLIGLLLPALQKVRESANRTRCANNLKQLALAAHAYQDSYGELPPSSAGGSGASDRPSWAVLVLPYVEQENLYRQFNLTQTYPNQSVAAVGTAVDTFLCPSRRTAAVRSKETPPGAVTDYAGCGGSFVQYTLSDPANRGAIVHPLNEKSRRTLAALIDGTSNILLIGEKHVARPESQFGTDQSYGDGCLWRGQWPRYSVRVIGGPDGPAQSPADTTGGAGIYGRKFGSYHPGVCQFAFADGRVRALPNTTDTTTLFMLAVIDDGGTPAADY